VQDTAPLAATEFDALISTLRSLPDPTKHLDEVTLHDCGIRLDQARRELASLRSRAAGQRESVIEAAGRSSEYLQLVADSSFSGLSMLARLAAAGNPVAELGYRLLALVVEAGAYAGGGLSAGSPVWPEVAVVLKNRAPGILVDFLMGRYLAIAKKGGYTDAQANIAEFIVRQVVQPAGHSWNEQKQRLLSFRKARAERKASGQPPPEHDQAPETWISSDGARKMRKNGFLVLEDGLVFHPDMLAGPSGTAP
jgi:hypothetical protein